MFMRMFMILFILLNLSCSGNILKEFANKETDQALEKEARKLINKRDYAGALLVLERMSETYRARREVVHLRASAHGGLCGLDYIQLVLDLEDLGNERLLVFLMQAFSGGTDFKINQCILAEEALKAAIPLGARDLDEHIFMIFLNFAKVGTILSRYADTDNDGEVDSDFNDACDNDQLVDDDDHVKHIGTGLASLILSFSEAGTSLPVGDDAIGTVSDFCDNFPPILADYNFCQFTDVEAITADMVKGIRTVVNEDQAIGLGSCSGDVLACACP